MRRYIYKLKYLKIFNLYIYLIKIKINAHTHCGIDTNSMMYPLDRKRNQKNCLIFFEVYNRIFYFVNT